MKMDLETKKEHMVRIGITDDTLNEIMPLMKEDPRYGSDDDFVHDALREFPENTDRNLVAMKIALIDMTNSTSLSRLTGNKEFDRKNRRTGEIQRVKRDVLNLQDIVGKIVSIKDFDERIKNGDVTIVSELARWSSNFGDGLNLFSFFSKYCLYHNYHAYARDDFSIYDSVVRDHLGDYLSTSEYSKLLGGKTLRKNQSTSSAVAGEIEKMRRKCDYAKYRDLIDSVLKIKGVSNGVESKRRKLDLFIWYLNRTNH